MRKGATTVQNIQLLRWCTEYGVSALWNILTGFPGEDEDEFARIAGEAEALHHLEPPFRGDPPKNHRAIPISRPNFLELCDELFERRHAVRRPAVAGDLPAGASATLMQYISFTPAGGADITALATVSTDKTDPVLGDNQAGATLTVSGPRQSRTLGELTLTNSTVSGNFAAQKGGGIYAVSELYTDVVNSTISGNVANQDGGGVYLGHTGALSLVNSTISGNAASVATYGRGGGLFVAKPGTADLINVTVENETLENVVNMFTRISGAGQAASNADRPSSVVTSATTGVAEPPPAAAMSAAARSSVSSWRAQIQTLTPSAASAIAQALPSPLLDAQTIALFPVIPRSMTCLRDSSQRRR